MIKRKYGRIPVTMVTAVLLSSGTASLGHAAESNVMKAEGAMQAPTYIPPAPPATAPPAYTPSEVPPDYVPAPPQQASPAPAYTPPPPPSYVAPAPVQAPVVLPAAPPQFVYVPELGYYVAMGVAFDMIYDGQAYYYHNGGYWYRTSYYGAPWAYVAPRLLPQVLVRFSFRDIHRFRDREYKRYNRDRGHYRGRLHRPEIRREIRREERGGR